MLTMLERGPDGRYPERLASQASWLLPLTEYTRQAIITGAGLMDVEVVATSSDGAATRRETLLQRLGPGSREIVLDPGRAVVEANLAGPDGVLSDQCGQAINRWYGRL